MSAPQPSPTIGKRANTWLRSTGRRCESGNEKAGDCVSIGRRSPTISTLASRAAFSMAQICLDRPAQRAAYNLRRVVSRRSVGSRAKRRAQQATSQSQIRRRSQGRTMMVMAEMSTEQLETSTIRGSWTFGFLWRCERLAV